MANPKYPQYYDDEQTTTPPFLPNVSESTNVADYVNRLKQSIIAVERELGIKPSGAQATVSERLDLLEANGGDSIAYGESIHRVQIADKYSLNDIYSIDTVVGQITFNGLEETNLFSSSTSEVTIKLKINTYVQKNTILTTKLYDITNGIGTLISTLVFNDGYGSPGGQFYNEDQLTIVTDIPLSNRVYELRASQVATSTETEEEKTIIWDASLLVKSTNTESDGYSSGNGIGAISPVFVQQVVAGVAVTPGWETIGAFTYNGIPGKLSAMVLVSQAALTTRLRLYGPIGGTPAEITGSVISSVATSEEVINSSELTSELTSGEIYQIQMECTGGALITDFAIARYAALVVL